MAKYQRLQGSEWHNMKHKLRLKSYEISKTGNYKGFYESEDGTIYTHWMNDWEKEKFLWEVTNE